MHIFHGDNQVASRFALSQVLDEARRKQTPITALIAAKIERPSLESALMSHHLFAENQVVLIEQLHSLPQSKKKTELIELVSNSSNPNHNIILWENRSLTPTMLKKFAGAKIQEFKTSNLVFEWIDQLNPLTPKSRLITSFHEAVKKDGVEICFAMLIRQLRLLIQSKESFPIAGPPFMLAKLKKQASAFTLSELASLHIQVFSLELNHKTSRSHLDLVAMLDLLQLSM